MTFGAVDPPGLLEEQGAVIFGQAEISPTLLHLSRRPRKEKRLYSQENVPLLEETSMAESMDFDSLTDCESSVTKCEVRGF